MSETLELIESFDLLRTDDLAIIKCCVRCGEDHCFRLLGLGRYPILNPGDIASEDGTGYLVHPQPPCCDVEFGAILDQAAVEQRRVYRMVDAGTGQPLRINGAFGGGPS